MKSSSASCLVGVIYQRLLPAVAGKRVAAYEVLVANHAVRNLIREGQTVQIPNAMMTGSVHGMKTMNRALEELVGAGTVTEEEAIPLRKANQ